MRTSPMARAVGIVVLFAGLCPRSAAAQLPDRPIQVADGRVTLSGEFTASESRQDADAFFNYTDYEHNALRLVRLRLLGEWRIRARLELLGELRTEDGNGVQTSAAYLRWQPWATRALDFQVGVIPPVVGAFPRRAYGRDNPLIGTPLAYQYLTSLRPDALPATVNDLLRMRARGWQPSFPIGATTVATGVPLVDSSRWDTGVQVAWHRQRVELAGAYTLGAPATPEVRDTTGGREWSGRLAVQAPAGFTFGVSGARGHWINTSVLTLVPESRRGQSTQSVVGADMAYGWSRWLVQAEWLRSVFQIPLIGVSLPTPALAATSEFLEGRYRLHPRWQVAGRVEHLQFSDVTSTSSGAVPVPWDIPVTRAELVLGLRAWRNLDLRAGWQQDWRDGGRVHQRGYPALQVLYWF
jgi:hypothetical protein